MNDGGKTEPLPAAGDAPQTVVSDQQIAEALHNILLQTNPNFFNLNVVVQHLQSRLGFPLSHKLDFIRFHINHFFSKLQAQSQYQAQYQAQTQAHVHDSQQQHHQLQLQHEQQEVKYRFALHQNRNYHFPPNFTLQPQLSVPAQPASAAVEAPKAGVQSGKKRRGGPGGLNKLCGVTPELETIVGQPTMPRTEIVKQLWAYIRKHNLQDPSNKRKINCNDELRLLFETDCTDMFKMNKLLSKHILTLDPAQTSKKIKVDTESGSESTDSVPIVIISEVLANFFGTEEREISQAEVLRQMWEYIKINKLEDPANSMAIHCDEKLKELFGCESISALGIPEMLTRLHLTNKS